jgi:hypothetical protein
MPIICTLYPHDNPYIFAGSIHLIQLQSQAFSLKPSGQAVPACDDGLHQQSSLGSCKGEKNQTMMKDIAVDLFRKQDQHKTM